MVAAVLYWGFATPQEIIKKLECCWWTIIDCVGVAASA